MNKKNFLIPIYYDLDNNELVADFKYGMTTLKNLYSKAKSSLQTKGKNLISSTQKVTSQKIKPDKGFKNQVEDVIENLPGKRNNIKRYIGNRLVNNTDNVILGSGLLGASALGTGAIATTIANRKKRNKNILKRYINK